MMKVYLAGPIFTERDRNFNSLIESKILAKCSNIDLYLAQNNKSINDKEGCATSADIYAGDVKRLRESDMVITIMSADTPPIGSSYECAYFTSLCEKDESKCIVALYDDCRDGCYTYSSSKVDAMISGNAENQWSYINLLAVGFIKKFGDIYFDSESFVDAIVRKIKLFQDSRTSGIYKVVNLKNNLVYIGQTIDFHKRKLEHWRSYKYSDTGSCKELYEDMSKLGLDYFKFEILEKCNVYELDDREKYWISYYDSYNLGYNSTTGGNSDKLGYETGQTVHVYAYDTNGNFVNDYISIADAVRRNNMKSNNITRCIQFDDNKHLSGGFMWRLYKADKIAPYESKTSGKHIYAYDKETRMFFRAYDNAIKASNEFGFKRNTHINDCAIGERQSSCGLLWAYDYYERLPEDYYKKLNKPNGNKLRVYSYSNISGEFIKEYESITAAITDTGYTDVAEVAYGRQKPLGELTFSFDKYDNILSELHELRDMEVI